ncbi:MAG: hypothetical protein JWR27_2084, partial [Aeromicrobium sp.]|nr:hypothetical protein [Aeromicrobium sp.]
PAGASGPDEFTQFQMTMAHVFGHPRLRHIAQTLSQESEQDPRQIFIDHGVALPSNATVGRSGTESDRPGEYSICVGSTIAHCVFFTLPSIHITST